jgi:hypothetical protein
MGVPGITIATPYRSTRYIVGETFERPYRSDNERGTTDRQGHCRPVTIRCPSA